MSENLTPEQADIIANLTPEQVLERINGLFDVAMETMATVEQVEELKSAVNSLKNLDKKNSEMEKTIARFEGKLEAMNSKAVHNVEAPSRSLGQAMVKSFANNHKTILDTIEKGQTFNLDVKTDTTITGDYTGNIALSVLDPEVNRIARPTRRILEIANVGTTTSKFVTYIQQTTQSTGAWVAESVAKAQGQVQYQEVSVEVKKVAATLKVSKEMMSDLAFVSSEVNIELMANVEQKIDYSLLNGAGGTDLVGLVSTATTWAAGTFAGTITQPNVSDVIRVGKAQSEALNFYPTHVVLHPSDVAAIQLTKSTTGEYTYPIFLPTTGEMMIAGLIIVQSNNITAGTFLIGDYSKANVKIREAVNMSVGYVDDDFQRNMVTILCEARLVNYVKANDTGAFIKGVFATCIAAL
jgi:HK97 family phage major capsid protein